MDPFTQRMMERARVRREKLDSEMAAVGQSNIKKSKMPLLESNVMANTTSVRGGEPDKCFIEEIKSQKNNLKAESPVLSPKKPIEETVEKENTFDVILQPPVSSLHSKLNRLGKLYAGPENLQSLSSPVHHRTETLSRYDKVSATKSESSTRSRFADLARRIEEWEDDLSTITPTPKKEAPKSLAVRGSPKAGPSTKDVESPLKTGTNIKNMGSPVKPVTQVKLSTSVIKGSPVKSPAQQSMSPRGVQMGIQGKSPARVTSFMKKATTKSVIWDQSVLASLEAQGYVASKRRSRLVYNFESRYSSQQEEEQREVRVVQSSGSSDVIEEDEECSEPASPYTGSVSSPGWVYKAGSPVKPRMGLQSPLKKLTSMQPTTPSPVKITPVAKINSPSPRKVASPVSRSPSKLLSARSSGSVLQRAAMFESAAAVECSSPTIDPANLPLAQRKALFEKNKSQGPLIPKVAFATPLPAKLISQSSSLENSRPNESTKSTLSEVQKTKSGDASRPKLSEGLQKEIQKAAVRKGPTVAAKTKVLAQKTMFEQNTQEGPKHTEVVAASLSERQKELEMLRSRWEKQKQMAGKLDKDARSQEHKETEPDTKETKMHVDEMPPPPPPAPPKTLSTTKSTSPTKKYPGVDSVRNIHLSPPKAGRLYPCLSDIEVTESEADASTTSSSSRRSSMDASASDTSFGDEILQAAGLNRDKTPVKRDANAMTASECAVLNDMDEYLDEALGSDAEFSYVGPTPPKKSKDFEESKPLEVQQHTSAAECSEPQPLLHTVSFYRKQQAKGARLATPVKQIIRHSDSESESDEDVSEIEEREVQHKIKSLQEEISKQQSVIFQSSQALNLCRSVVEFSNSPEQVECERLLLVATHKRQALLNEIQRLKVEGTVQREHTESGSLTVSNLTLPLKKEFLARIRHGQDEDTEYYILCLVRCQEHLLASPMVTISKVPITEDCVHFPGSLTLEDLGSDFAITLEVYTLKARRETISHEEKYHIKKEASKMRLTPKKSKNINPLVMPVVQSPAGPGAVRTSSFLLSGFTVFSLREIGRSYFILNKVPYASPLEGHVNMKLSCKLKLDTEQRSFLTMFEDISGYGAWHRRWCVLNGSRLSYWKYPDDEKKKKPIGYLDLHASCTKDVGLVPRDVCARPNTFLLETRRAPQPKDSKSLVMIPCEQYTIIRHLLSADTKEERVQWCKELNRALSSMRAWRASTNSNSKTSVATAI